MAGMTQQVEIELGGTKYIGKVDIDVCEKIEDTLDMGALQILRAAATPTITTRQITAVLALTLHRYIPNPDVSLKPTPIGQIGARMLVDKVGYFEATAAVLKIVGQWFKDDAKQPEAGPEAA